MNEEINAKTKTPNSTIRNHLAFELNIFEFHAIFVVLNFLLLCSSLLALV